VLERVEKAVTSFLSWLQVLERFSIGLRQFSMSEREMVIVCGVRMSEWNIWWRISRGRVRRVGGGEDMCN
jgi:hypothetical protein